MAKFEVKVEGAKYEVDAPNEETAWLWANQTHMQGKILPTESTIDKRQETYNPTAEMSTPQLLAAGAGKSVYDTARGLGQITGVLDKKQIEEADALDKPLMKTNAGVAGNIGGQVMQMIAPGGMLRKTKTAQKAIQSLNDVRGGSLIPPVIGSASFAATQPVTGDDSRAGNMVEAGLAGAAGQAGVNKLVTMGRNAAAQEASKLLEKSQNSIRDKTLKESIDSGYVVTPTLANGSKTAKTIEGLTGSARANQLAMVRNQPNTNRLAKEYLGIGDDVPLSDDILDVARQPHNQVYEEIASLPAIKPAPGYLGTKAPVTKDGRAVLEELKQTRFDAKEYHRHSNITGDPNSAKQARALDAKAKELETQLEDMAQASGNPGLVDRFRSARRELAKINTIENVVNPATGDVDAVALGKLYKKGAPLDGAAKKIADFANAYSGIAKVPGPGYGAGVTAVDAGLMSGGLAGGNAGLAALPAARYLGRNAIMGKTAQEKLANKSYETSASNKLLKDLLTEENVKRIEGAKFLLPALVNTSRE